MTYHPPLRIRSRLFSRLGAIGLLAASLWTPPLYAAPGDEALIGTWLTSKADSKVEVYPCGKAEFCGRLAWIKDSVDAQGRPHTDTENPDASLRSRPVKGLAILNGLKSKGPGKWEAGTIYDPESGKTYRCKAELDGSGKLKFRGFVGVSLLGKTEVWTRTE